MSKWFDQVINECFDITDNKTRKTLLSLNEANQDKVLMSLSNKLYGFIIDKVADIDYGEIPSSKGDITKIPNYLDMVECLNTIRELIIEYKQDTTSVDTVLTAIDNIKNTKDLWDRAYGVKCEMAMTIYNTYALSCVAATSLLITASIEFVKDPSTSTFNAAIDRTGVAKSKDKLLLKSLKSLNDSCKKQELQKSVDWMIKSQKSLKEFTMITQESIAGILAGIAISATVIACIPRIILPAIYQAVSFLYEMRQSVADYFAIQSQIVRMNAENLQYNSAKSPEQIKKIVDRQKKIADDFAKISNKLSIKINSSNKNATKDSDATLSKKKIDDLDMEDDNGDESTSDGSIFSFT